MGKPWENHGKMVIYMENHHVSWENSLFLWPCSIAFCMFTRGYQITNNPPPLFRQVMPQRPLRISRSSPGQNRVLPAVDTQYLQKGTWGFGWGFVNGYNYGDIMISIICWDTKPVTSFNYGCMNISTYLHSWNYTPKISPNMEYHKKNMSLHVLH